MENASETIPREAPPAPAAAVPAAPSIAPQECACEAPAAAAEAVAAAPSAPIFVYSIGKIRAAFPSSSVKAEFKQANWLNLPPTDSGTQYTILSQPRNNYLARAMCWIQQIDAGQAIDVNNAAIDTFVDSYIVKPQTQVELNALITALAPVPTPQPGNPPDELYTVVQGIEGPIASSEACDGLQLPLLATNVVFSFLRSTFLIQIQTLAKVQSTGLAGILLDQMLLASSNNGNSDAKRAINWLTVQTLSWEIYSLLATMEGYSTDTNSPYKLPGVFTLAAIDARPVAQGTRRLVEVIFRFSETNVGELVNWFCVVDVTGEFPFFVRHVSRFYEAI